MDALRQDLRFALRALRRSPGLFAAAVLSLSLGVAANTTIFSAVDVFLYRPLPYPEADRIAYVWNTDEERGWTETSVSVPDFLDWREQSRTLDLASFWQTSFNVAGGDRPERIEGARVSEGFFRVIGVPPLRGRAFRADEEPAGSDRVVMIGESLWQRRFAADPAAIGSSIEVNGEPHTIVGIVPASFTFPSSQIELWKPLGRDGTEDRASHFLRVIGRMRGGFDYDDVVADMARVASSLEAAYPASNRGIGTNPVLLKGQMFDETFRTASMICTVAVAFVLLIACANIANLLLAKAASREREIAVRSCMGAGRGRIIRQLLTESLVLASAGGVVGLVLSIFGIRWLVSMMPAWFPMRDHIGLDARAVIFTLAITAIAGIMFGLAPALQGGRQDLNRTLREAGGRGTTIGGRTGRLRAALVMGEIGLALALLVSAGLLIKGYVSVRDVDPGFVMDDVLTARVALLERDYADSVVIGQFYDRFLERVRALPGVRAAGITTVLPLRGGNGAYYDRADRPSDDPARRPVAQYRTVDRGYFDAMDIRLLEGRHFESNDRIGSVPVMVVNRAFADLVFPDRSAIGGRIVMTSGEREIVGIVEDTRDFGPEDEPPPMMYLPAGQRTYANMAIVVRSSGDPAALAGPMRAELAALDAGVPLYAVATMRAVFEEETGGDTIMVKLLTLFGAMALVLAVLGVYGVMAYTVSQRVQEVGVRMALGAQGRDIVRLIVRQGAVLAGIGLISGLAIALGTARFLSAFLYGVSPFDLVTFATATLSLLAAALFASWVPAVRAARIDPVDALRSD